MYKITYTYSTCSTRQPVTEETGEFPVTWSSMDEAKCALQRMKEHYDWQYSCSCAWGEDQPQPSWWKPHPGRGMGQYQWYFNVPGNDEEVWVSGSTYLGYFENLLEAKIVGVDTAFSYR